MLDKLEPFELKTAEAGANVDKIDKESKGKSCSTKTYASEAPTQTTFSSILSTESNNEGYGGWEALSILLISVIIACIYISYNYGFQYKALPQNMIECK